MLDGMAIPKSRLSPQGQISIPAEVRRKLGLSPGSVVEWEEQGDGAVVMRRGGKYTMEDLHNRLFPDGPPPYKTREKMRAAVDEHLRTRHARR